MATLRSGQGLRHDQKPCLAFPLGFVGLTSLDKTLSEPKMAALGIAFGIAEHDLPIPLRLKCHLQMMHDGRAKTHSLMAAIHHVHAGDAVMAPSTTRRLIEHFALPPPVVDDGDDRFRALEDLTAREREVLARVARGLSNEAIARDLRVAEGTVRVHVSRILGKLGLRDRAQAVVLAYESGLVSPRRDTSRADRDLQRDGRVEP